MREQIEAVFSELGIQPLDVQRVDDECLVWAWAVGLSQVSVDLYDTGELIVGWGDAKTNQCGAKDVPLEELKEFLIAIQIVLAP
jgi:hypothetical protein